MGSVVIYVPVFIEIGSAIKAVMEKIYGHTGIFRIT
jgi:hypothetical protein